MAKWPIAANYATPHHRAASLSDGEEVKLRKDSISCWQLRRVLILSAQNGLT
jgi:hypothetical protein